MDFRQYVLFWGGAETMEKQVTCVLCPHHCRLAAGQVGYCGTRINEDGRLRSLIYGQITSLALDPIEKKPLYHFYPGTAILSVGSFGCNMRCPFCQNHAISQGRGETVQYYLSPEELTELAVRAEREQGSIGVAFTYNEPMLNYEYVLAAGKLLQAAGQKVVLVSNGQLEKEMVQNLLAVTDAVNIDIKAFSRQAYDWMGGSLQHAKQTVELALAMGVHVEVTTLVIPGINDDEVLFRQEVEWLSTCSPAVPLHLSRYFPRYQCTIPATPLSVLQRLQVLAKQKLEFVHLGNV